jgi:hypothetical protein
MLGGAPGLTAVAGRDDVGRCDLAADVLGRLLPLVVGLLRLLVGLFPVNIMLNNSADCFVSFCFKLYVYSRKQQEKFDCVL